MFGVSSEQKVIEVVESGSFPKIGNILGRAHFIDEFEILVVILLRFAGVTHEAKPDAPFVKEYILNH
jgi:hypothetical protein